MATSSAHAPASHTSSWQTDECTSNHKRVQRQREYHLSRKCGLWSRRANLSLTFVHTCHLESCPFVFFPLGRDAYLEPVRRRHHGSNLHSGAWCREAIIRLARRDPITTRSFGAMRKRRRREGRTSTCALLVPGVWRSFLQVPVSDLFAGFAARTHGFFHTQRTVVSTASADFATSTSTPLSKFPCNIWHVFLF